MIEGLKLRISGGYTLAKSRNEQFNGSNTMTGHPAFPLGYGPNGQILWDETQTWLN